MSKQYTQSRNRVIPAQAALAKTTSIRQAPTRTGPNGLNGTNATRRRASSNTGDASKPAVKEQVLSELHNSFHAILLVRTTKSSSGQAPSLASNVSSWKERVVRVTKPQETNNGGCVEIFRLDREKNPEGEVGDLLLSANLKDLDQVAPGCFQEEEKKRFLRFDSATQKLVPEYLYGHVQIQLTFLRCEWSLIDLCCYTSVQRDLWYEFFSSLVYDKEYVGLLAVPDEVKVVCHMPDCSRDAVNRFFTLFMSQKPQVEEKQKEIIEERDEKDTQQLQFLAKRFDVILVQDELGTREHARIECPRPGLISVHGKRDFAVERGGVFQDPVNPDVFYLRPKRSDVVARDLGVQLTDGCLQVVATSDAREFRQWLGMLFGGVSRKEDMYLGEMHFGEQRSPSTDTGSAQSDDSHNNRASLLASSVFKPHGVRQRAESTCLVYLQYNTVGQPPTPETSFTECFSVLNPLQRRWYFVRKPPSKVMLVELFFDDITAVSGYSALYGMAGFAIHAAKINLELLVVPQDSASRNDWMRTVAECRLRVVKGKTREEWNAGCSERPLLCMMCGEESTKSLFCSTTNLPHTELLDELAHSPSSPSRYLNILGKRSVTTTSGVDSFLLEAKQALQRGREANELLKSPSESSLF